MTSYRQPKRKRVEIYRNPDDVAVRKPACGTVREPQKATESEMVPHLGPNIQLQIPSTKVKLQLFPISEPTHLVLEKDGYNPYLELTLSARKRISSVVRHLNAKWSRSTKVVGQLMLFPYDTELEELASCRRWTENDRTITAWEVYVDVGSPSIFRLRYGWFSNPHPEMLDIRPKSSHEAHVSSEDSRGDQPGYLDFPNHPHEQKDKSCDTIEKLISVNEALDSEVNELKASDLHTEQVDDEVRVEADPGCYIAPWDDNMTNLSIGGLLSEVSLQGKINGSDPNSVNKSGLQKMGHMSDTSIGDLFSDASLLGKMSNPIKLENESSLQPIFLTTSDVSIGGLFSDASLLSNKNKLETQRMGAGQEQIQSPWHDSFTTLSIGGLLSEASLQAKSGGNAELREIKSSLEPNASFSHSFNSQMSKSSRHEPSSSIFDAEETCHAFPTRKLQPSRDVTTSNAIVCSSGCSNGSNPKVSQFPEVAKITKETSSLKDSSSQELKIFSRNL